MSLRRTLFSLLLLAGVAVAQDYGSISGTVFGEDGQPVANAMVSAAQIFESNVAPMVAPRSKETDGDGHYSFDQLPLGRYHLWAWLLIGDHYELGSPFFILFNQQTAATLSQTNPNLEVDLKVGKKPAFVAGTVKDANTGALIDATVEFRCVIGTSFMYRGLSSQFDIPIPSDTPVTMKVSEGGYEDWWFARDGAVGAVQAKPGETLNIDVQLKPKGALPSSN